MWGTGRAAGEAKVRSNVKKGVDAYRPVYRRELSPNKRYVVRPGNLTFNILPTGFAATGWPRVPCCLELAEVWT